MTDSTSRSRAITYAPDALGDFVVRAYEWIDDLAFARDPGDLVDDPEAYVEVARRRFTEAGWRGDGTVGVIWVPPFALPERSQIAHSEGVAVWHVKQESDGTSWLLYPPGEWRW